MIRTGTLMFLGLTLALVAGACSDDEEAPAGPSGGKGGTAGSAGRGGSGGSAGSAGTSGRGGSGGTAGTTGTGGTGTGGTAGSAGTGGTAGDGGTETPAQRGEYLVKHVAACPDCHTPRKADGSPDTTKFLAGSPVFADLDPADTSIGAIGTPNLTDDDATGLGTWTDAQIKRAFLDGIKKDGTPLFPIMPYYVLHNMSAADADAIVAYLRTVPAVNNAIPARQQLPFPFTQPAAPVPATSLPNTTLASTDAKYASAQRGKYLAANVGVCMECHSPESAPGTPVPIDVAKLFLGKREFTRAQLGLPPVFPASIFSRNLTPHANGIANWTPTDVRNALKNGSDKAGIPLCPPMPAGPMQAFGGLTDQDALDIGQYLTTLAPADNGVIANCSPPPPPDASGDGAGGTSNDASAD
jgi:cytochrome c